MGNTSCPLLCLPVDVQGYIALVLKLEVHGGAQALLSLRVTSKRAASFGCRLVCNLALALELLRGLAVTARADLVAYPEGWRRCRALHWPVYEHQPGGLDCPLRPVWVQPGAAGPQNHNSRQGNSDSSSQVPRAPAAPRRLLELALPVRR